MAAKISIDRKALAAFCRQHLVRKLSLFGSVLREDFRQDSVEFEPGARVGLFEMAAMERELGGIVGRKVDLRTPAELSRYFRDEVIASAEVQYAAG